MESRSTLGLEVTKKPSAGLPKWRWLPDWVTQKVRSALELAERSLSFVNSSFPLGAGGSQKFGTILHRFFERSTWAEALGVMDVPGPNIFFFFSGSLLKG